MAIFGEFLRPVFSASGVQHVSDLHLKFALRPHHVWKYGRHPICDGWEYARKKIEERRNHRAKIWWPALFHRAAITNVFACVASRCSYHRWIVLRRQSRKCLLRGNYILVLHLWHLFVIITIESSTKSTTAIQLTINSCIIVVVSVRVPGFIS